MLLCRMCTRRRTLWDVWDVQLHSCTVTSVAVEVRAMSSSLSRIGLSLEMAAILECRLENQPDCCQPCYHGLSTNSKACSVALCTVSTVVARCRCVSWRGAQWWRAGSEMEDWRYGVEEEELSMIPTMIHDSMIPTMIHDTMIPVSPACHCSE